MAGKVELITCANRLSFHHRRRPGAGARQLLAAGALWGVPPQVAH